MDESTNSERRLYFGGHPEGFRDLSHRMSFSTNAAPAELLSSVASRTSLMSENALQKILFVEDDPDIQVIGSMALEQVGGFSVTLASSGIEALALVTESPPDLILLDVMMPGMDGLEALKRLRANPETKDIPVIFITAKVQNQEVNQYLESGAVAIIPKPFNPMTLANQVREIWQHIDGGRDA